MPENVRMTGLFNQSHFTVLDTTAQINLVLLHMKKATKLLQNMLATNQRMPPITVDMAMLVESKAGMPEYYFSMSVKQSTDKPD